jgi:hypothetical protein
MRFQQGAARKPDLHSHARPARVLQRACACGQHTHGESECAECRKKQAGALQRAASGPAANVAPPIVHDVLRAPGQPLDVATRAFMEPRFGGWHTDVHPVDASPQRSTAGLAIESHEAVSEREAEVISTRVTRTPDAAAQPRGFDFSRVRVHNDERAAESARSVGALAYTVGEHVVFGAGQYAPGSPGGQQLLAHELTHVIQQRGASGLQQRALQRRGGTAGGFFSNFGRSFVGLFGAEIGFSEDTLQSYLKTLDTTGDIEDDFDSDDKARAIVMAWRVGGSPYVLTAQRKALLIREMQSGPTGDDDEQAILEILERSYTSELAYIFGAGGVAARELNGDFHGQEWDWLQDFYVRRFTGGMAAVLKGSIQPIGQPVDFGTDIRAGSLIDSTLPGAVGEWNVACVLGILCSQDRGVVAQLPNLTVRVANTVTEVYWEFDGTAWSRKTRSRGAFSNADERVIGLKQSASCAIAASNIIHEVRHQNQPDQWTTLEKEKDAYTFEEDWTIQRGLPGRSKFRTTQPDGKETTNASAIDSYVRNRYSGGTAAPGEQVIGHTTAGNAQVRRPNGSRYERAPQPGDSHQDFEQTKQGLDSLPTIRKEQWICPSTKGGGS